MSHIANALFLYSIVLKIFVLALGMTFNSASESKIIILHEENVVR